MKAKVLMNPRANTVHTKAAEQHKILELQINVCVIKQRYSDIAVTTHSIITEASSLKSYFKNWDTLIFALWVHPFLSRKDLKIRMPTKTEQKLYGHPLKIKPTCSNNFAIAFKQNGKN